MHARGRARFPLPIPFNLPLRRSLRTFPSLEKSSGWTSSLSKSRRRARVSTKTDDVFFFFFFPRIRYTWHRTFVGSSETCCHDAFDILMKSYLVPYTQSVHVRRTRYFVFLFLRRHGRIWRYCRSRWAIGEIGAPPPRGRNHAYEIHFKSLYSDTAAPVKTIELH